MTRMDAIRLREFAGERPAVMRIPVIVRMTGAVQRLLADNLSALLRQRSRR